MSPWFIIGWIVLTIIAVRLTLALADIGNALLRDLGAGRRFRRANNGKLKCDQEGCSLPSTRRCPRGRYACERHFQNFNRTATVSFAIPLDYVRPRRNK